MAFLFYFAVLLFAAASAVFGLDLMTSPLPQHHAKPAVADAAAPSKPNQNEHKQAKKLASREGDKANSDRALSPVHPAKPGVPKSEVRTVYPPSNPALAAVVAKQNQANATAQTSPEPQQSTHPGTQTQTRDAAVQPRENQSEANSARAEATGSTPLKQADAADVAGQPNAEQASNRCNVQACAGAYQSFRASDCTYQPYDGPRRLCTKSTAPASRVASQPAPSQDRRQARRDADRNAGLRDAARRVRSMRNSDDRYEEYDDASVFDSLFGRHSRRVIVVPDDRYGNYYR